MASAMLQTHVGFEWLERCSLSPDVALSRALAWYFGIGVSHSSKSDSLFATCLTPFIHTRCVRPSVSFRDRVSVATSSEHNCLVRRVLDDEAVWTRLSRIRRVSRCCLANLWARKCARSAAEAFARHSRRTGSDDSQAAERLGERGAGSARGVACGAGRRVARRARALS